MTRPPRAKPVNQWAQWPQKLAANTVRSLYPFGSSTVWRRGYSMLDIMLGCAQELAKKKRVKLEDVVVFYPQARYPVALRKLQKMRKATGGVGKFKGLTISGTRKLEGNCMAFLIKDVEAHRTPADAYYTTFHPQARAANPLPLYDEEESKTGKAVHR